jgi:hypothetical protein
VAVMMMSNHASATSKVASTAAGNTTPECQAGGQVYGQHLDQVKAAPGETVMVP